MLCHKKAALDELTPFVEGVSRKAAFLLLGDCLHFARFFAVVLKTPQRMHKCTAK